MASSPTIRSLVTGGGTGVGMKNIAEGNSDIGMASREVTADEKSQFRRQVQGEYGGL